MVFLRLTLLIPGVHIFDMTLLVLQYLKLFDSAAKMLMTPFNHIATFDSTLLFANQ